MFEMIIEYIVDEALIVIPVLLVLGKMIKNTPKVQDWMIPYILTPIGVLLSVGLMGVSVGSVIQGVLVSGASVLSNQLWKQAKIKDK